MPVEFFADAIIAIDNGSRRLFVDVGSNLVYREMTPTATQSCQPLRELWESRVSSSQVLYWSPTGFIETLVSGTPVIRLNDKNLATALNSAVKQLVSLQDLASAETSEAHVERGFEILKGADQGHFRRLRQLEAELAGSPLVPAGSDNSPRNALFDGEKVTFVDVCPVTTLPAFVRPLGLVAAWTAGRRTNLASRWNSVVRPELEGLFPTPVDNLDDALLHSLTHLAIACEGALDLPLADAHARYSWLIKAYRL